VDSVHSSFGVFTFLIGSAFLKQYAAGFLRHRLDDPTGIKSRRAKTHLRLINQETLGLKNQPGRRCAKQTLGGRRGDAHSIFVPPFFIEFSKVILPLPKQFVGAQYEIRELVSRISGTTIA
jgi:hypothetical protein